MATPDNLPLRDLQKIILGKREEPLSVIEIRNLFSYPTTPESILYIITALNRNKIDPNTTLVQGIANASKKQDLIPIALALRYGADPNLYVNAPNVGDIHILGYSYLALSSQDLPVLNSIIIMLMATGANPNHLMFDAKGGVIKDEYSLVEPITGHSVIEWLDDQGYDTIIPQVKGQNYDNVEVSFMTTLAIFLDNPELVPTKVIPTLDEVIGSHSLEILKSYMKDYKNPLDGLTKSRNYLNLTSYELFTNLGAMPNYGEINDLILSVGIYKKLGDFISMGQVREMLLNSVLYGANLDTYQIDLIKDTDDRMYDKIMAGYSQPYWIKACSTCKGTSDSKLKRLAYNLNLYPEAPKDTLCHEIKNITKADPKLVKESAVRRQISRIRSDVAYINQFDNGCAPPEIKCNNRSITNVTNVYDFPDADIAYYRDFQGALWCFTSNNFVKMVSKKINPYTTEEFPEYFINEVNRKIEFIKKYRSIDDKPITISDTVSDLSKPDQPDDQITDRYIQNFLQMVRSKNITSWNIKNINNDEMENIILANFNIRLDLVNLSRPHAEKTFLVVSYEELKLAPDKANNYFKQMEEK